MTALYVLRARFCDIQWPSTSTFEVLVRLPRYLSTSETSELRELHLFGRSLERALYGGQVLEVAASEWPGWTYCTVRHDENQASHWPFWDRELNFKLLPLTTSAWPELTAEAYDERSDRHEAESSGWQDLAGVTDGSRPPSQGRRPNPAPQSVERTSRPEELPLAKRRHEPPSRLKSGDLFVAELYDDPLHVVVRVFWAEEDFDETEMRLRMVWPAADRPLQSAERATFVTQALAPFKQRPGGIVAAGYALTAMEAVAVVALLVPAHDRIAHVQRAQ